jgi:hypothetical protein
VGSGAIRSIVVIAVAIPTQVPRSQSDPGPEVGPSLPWKGVCLGPDAGASAGRKSAASATRELVGCRFAFAAFARTAKIEFASVSNLAGRARAAQRFPHVVITLRRGSGRDRFGLSGRRERWDDRRPFTWRAVRPDRFRGCFSTAWPAKARLWQSYTSLQRPRQILGIGRGAIELRRTASLRQHATAKWR